MIALLDLLSLTEPIMAIYIAPAALKTLPILTR